MATFQKISRTKSHIKNQEYMMQSTRAMAILSALTSALVAATELGVATRGPRALNLLDSSDFYVCGSGIDGMNGHYILSEEHQSDLKTPVFVRKDEDEVAATTTHDFRLYRHNGFWLFADVGAWPPKTYFRCDPTQPDAMETCGIDLSTPPRVGYRVANSTHGVHSLALSVEDCSQPLTTPKPEL